MIVLDKECLSSILGIRNEGNTITIDSNKKTINKDPDWNYEATCDRLEIRPHSGDHGRVLHMSWHIRGRPSTVKRWCLPDYAVAFYLVRAAAEVYELKSHCQQKPVADSRLDLLHAVGLDKLTNFGTELYCGWWGSFYRMRSFIPFFGGDKFLDLEKGIGAILGKKSPPNSSSISRILFFLSQFQTTYENMPNNGKISNTNNAIEQQSTSIQQFIHRI
ncbi:hypothetical protein M9H77_03470 [Catharanthus roseus]|uniref:Uncharacterized protein n=1 Tax=Catharanthus roseus TaxID=4058 RepID=A0ACC0CBL7_CATRO|nr:hypothetical protein M9H77_03470 [Catharanthus roseus]